MRLLLIQVFSKHMSRWMSAIGKVSSLCCIDLIICLSPWPSVSDLMKEVMKNERPNEFLCPAPFKNPSSQEIAHEEKCPWFFCFIRRWQLEPQAALPFFRSGATLSHLPLSFPIISLWAACNKGGTGGGEKIKQQKWGHKPKYVSQKDDWLVRIKQHTFIISFVFAAF